MCRLLGWAAHTPRTLADLLGEEDLAEFTALSRKHGDGWGVAWHTGEGLQLRKTPDAACSSGEYEQWVHDQATDLGLVHLRWATLGLPVEPANTHPFGYGDVAFAHNGSVSPPASLDELLGAEQRSAMQGTTDSERFFRAVLSASQDGARDGGLDTALAGTVTRIAREKKFTSLNCLLATPDVLYAVCRFDPGHEGDEEEDYFHLRYRVTDDAVVVSSTGWGRDWEVLGNGELLVVQRKTLETSIRTLDEVLIRS
jgi:predicted glutamine amidotransferase